MHPEYVWSTNVLSEPKTLAGDGGPDSFFDVFLDVAGLELGPREVLLARQRSTYTNLATGAEEEFWQYELHQAHIPEPATLVNLAGLGLLLGLGAFYRWRRKR